MIEGKTKILEPGEKPFTLVIRTKDELTGGDAAKRAHIAGIAANKTRQAANVFSFLESQGIPTAFREQLGPTELLVDDCDMLPLELVTRRYAFGSFLKRRPEFFREGAPERFADIVWEVFHKQTVVTPPHFDQPVLMDEEDARRSFLNDGEWESGVYTDPFVLLDHESWALYPAKEPFDEVDDAPLLLIPAQLPLTQMVQIKDQLMLPCFHALEFAWGKVQTEHGPVALVDMKIEVGRRKADNQIVIADVIDNDSWRIWPGANPANQLDKQAFRDDSPLAEVADKYELVTQLTEQFMLSF